VKADFLLHACDNPPCVNPKHLKEGTAKKNALDMMVKGRRTQGHHVTQSEFITIQKQLPIAKSLYQIKKMTGINWHIIRDIRDGTHWSCQVYGT